MVRLTNYTDYSLRVLIYLGTKGKGTKATITEITEAYGVSRNHLTKVIHQLGKHGFIETIQGRGGGIVLNKDPQEIVVGDVVRQMEEDFYLVECFNREINTCILSPICGLQGMLREALNAYLSVLDKYTLADIIVDQDAYKRLLKL